jgi:DNA-binding NtrC family response regulator
LAAAAGPRELQPMSPSFIAETQDESQRGTQAVSSVCFLFHLLDCERPWAGGTRLELRNTDEVTIGRGEEWCAERSGRALALTLPNATLSSNHVRLLHLRNQWTIQDCGSRNGTWIHAQRVDRAELSSGDIFLVGRSFFMFRRYELPSLRVAWSDRTEPDAAEVQPIFHTLSPEVALDNEELLSLAQTDISVLILGETGTGKELAAQALHEASGRRGRLCAVNCGAIPAGLVESTLFGHVKGAFSGALSHQLGLIRAADKGTLFLDEVGEFTHAAQTTLLRVLQEREVTPVGAVQSFPVDVRIVSATHQPLERAVREGRFRADLYARLAGSVHRLRPLAARLEDFGVLFAQLLRRAAGPAASEVTLSADAGWALLRHGWPLNVRELEQAIARAVALGYQTPLGVHNFPFVLEQPTRPGPVSRSNTPNSEAALRRQLDELMREHHGNVTAVARALGKGPTQIQRWLKRVGLAADAYRG